MTGRTHDLAAITALNFFIITQTIPKFSLATALFSVIFCFLGGLFPDIDQPSSNFWDKIPGGSLIGKLVQPFLGAHRHFSHSILGVLFYGYLVKLLLNLVNSFILVDMQMVWGAFMIGMISHLVMDSLTKEGVPWLFPLDFHFKLLGIKTGGVAEKFIIFPMLIGFNIYLFYTNYQNYLIFLKNLI